MAQSKLEERLSGLISQLAITNEGMMNLTKLSEKHEGILYGKDENGGLISRNGIIQRTLEDHEATLQRLETSCQQVVNFMESQVEINRSQAETNRNVSRVVFAIAGMTFLILLLIGVADISALHNLLSGIHLVTP